uniref:VWFA domain-containing protein n=1 Tax=Mastacembelus armatus TaxID=205130 RepID=A0A3Q3MDL5_9TELE
METFRCLLALLCVFLAGAQTSSQRNRLAECPVDLFFVLDTSESVALRQKPPSFYIDQIKEFTKHFIDELKDMRHQCDRILTWNSGALHYSDEVIIVRELSDMSTDRQALKNDIDKISYIGKGTYTDCAIRQGIAELLVGGSHYQDNKYIVVVTDGHPITGYKEPCGGLQEAANEARQHKVKVFSVAISPDQEDTRLSVIATDQSYRQNFTAADDTRSTKHKTIRSIIEMIVCIFSSLLSSLLLSSPLLSSLLLSSLLLSSPLLSSPLLFSSLLCSLLLSSHLLSFSLFSSPLLFSPLFPSGEAGFPGLPGCKGSPGADGLQGEPGPKGDPGPYGQKGGKGDPGKDGEPGRPGNYGPLGPQGDRGPRGADGDKGERGDDGAPGPDGVRGERGQLGEKGEQGSRGNRGPRGELGEPGPRGEQGREGSAGGNGDTVRHIYSNISAYTLIQRGKGRSCLLALCGEDGPPGNGTVGCHGFQGYPGPRGDPGELNNQPGPPGAKGAKGHRGPEGQPVRKLQGWDMKCKCAPLDLAFIVDSSESIGATNFALAKDFIITVIDRLIKDQQFAGNESRVSVVQYSGARAQEVVQLGTTITTLTDFKQAVRDLRWLAEATYTGEALDFALTNTIKLMRQENRVVLVLTDGRSDISRDKVPLDVLCGQNVRVGGLGVKDYSGRQPNQEQLDDVVCKSDPKPGFSFVLENFAELLDDTFLQNLTSTICQEYCACVCVAVSFTDRADILMMMDSSASVGQKNFESSKAFVRLLANRFLTAEKKRGAPVRVAVGQYSRNAKMEQALTTNFTLLSHHVEEAAFQNDGTNVLEAMEFAIKNLPARGDAAGGKKKLVLFSDGRSQAVTEAVLEKRVREVADAGVELFVIAVGNQVNEANLRTLVSRGRQDDNAYAQRHMLRVPDYPSLLRGVFYQTVSRRVSMS